MNADGTYRHVSDTGYTYDFQDEYMKLAIKNVKMIHPIKTTWFKIIFRK